MTSSLKCYICGGNEKITSFLFRNGYQRVCMTCNTTLIEGLFIYKEKHPEFQHEIFNDKNAQHMISLKKFERECTDAFMRYEA